jgi:hypothetical protein
MMKINLYFFLTSSYFGTLEKLKADIKVFQNRLDFNIYSYI